jgi:hypothetical protein
MSNTESLQELQQARTGPKEESKRLEEKRRSLEEKTRLLEEKARAGKLAIDKQLLVQILEEENLTHDAAVKELQDKIANLEQQLKPSPPIESAPSQTASEPTQETTDDVDEDVSAGLLPPPEQGEVEVSKEGLKKKRRITF